MLPRVTPSLAPLEPEEGGHHGCLSASPLLEGPLSFVH